MMTGGFLNLQKCGPPGDSSFQREASRSFSGLTTPCFKEVVPTAPYQNAEAFTHKLSSVYELCQRRITGEAFTATFETAEGEPAASFHRTFPHASSRTLPQIHPRPSLCGRSATVDGGCRLPVSSESPAPGHGCGTGGHTCAHHFVIDQHRDVMWWD